MQIQVQPRRFQRRAHLHRRSSQVSVELVKNGRCYSESTSYEVDEKKFVHDEYNRTKTMYIDEIRDESRSCQQSSENVPTCRKPTLEPPPRLYADVYYPML